METNSATFEGWAIVEIMGHQRIAGYVTTEAFGSVIMFKVTAPEVPDTESVFEEDRYFQGRILGKGSKIGRGRPRLETRVGAASIYRMTSCTEEEALAANPLLERIIEAVPRPPAAFLEYQDEDEDERPENDVPY